MPVDINATSSLRNRWYQKPKVDCISGSREGSLWRDSDPAQRQSSVASTPAARGSSRSSVLFSHAVAFLFLALGSAIAKLE